MGGGVSTGKTVHEGRTHGVPGRELFTLCDRNTAGSKEDNSKKKLGKNN